MKTILTVLITIVIPLNASAQQNVVSIQEGLSQQQLEQFYYRTKLPLRQIRKCYPVQNPDIRMKIFTVL